ncbi:MAG: hypothetical protein GX455_10975 [Phycisphaerae bacterium]|nr:hypothetical protein [Phycisphaerae bacterium]
MKKCAGYAMIVPLIFGLGLLVGCQETNESAIVKKARLVGQENIELKKQIKKQDQAIQEQKHLLEECRQEMIKSQEDATDTNAKMLEIASKSATEAEELRVENEKLKARILELESGTPKP